MRVLQLADSALPVGSFSFSHGLETAVATGRVKTPADLEAFVTQLVQIAAATDGIALLHAWRGQWREADQAAYNRKLNEETRQMSVRMGKKLAEIAPQLGPAPTVQTWLEAIQAGHTPGTWPAGQGLLAKDLELTEEEAFAVHQYGVASAVLGASLRLMRIDHRDTQGILARVNQRAQQDYERMRAAKLQDMAAYAPVLDILAAVHVQAHVRLFMN